MGFWKGLVDKATKKKEELEEEAKKRAAKKAAEMAIDTGKAAARSAVKNAGKTLDYAGKKVVVIGSGATAITLVPMSAPSITASAAGSAIRPWPTKAETISAVAVLDWTMAVTPTPESAAVSGVRTLREMIWRKLVPNTRKMPVRTSWVPQTRRATAAKRLRRCFMK